MKFVLQIIVSLLHPIGTILGWINLLGRSDLSTVMKIVWAVALIIPFGPTVYVLVGGSLW